MTDEQRRNAKQRQVMILEELIFATHGSGKMAE